MSSRLNLLLLLALVVSSLVLVKVSYHARSLFVALERAQAEARALETDYKRLDAERQAQSNSRRVERIALEKLNMRVATPGVTHYVTDSAGAAEAPAPAIGAPYVAATAAARPVEPTTSTTDGGSAAAPGGRR